MGRDILLPTDEWLSQDKGLFIVFVRVLVFYQFIFQPILKTRWAGEFHIVGFHHHAILQDEHITFAIGDYLDINRFIHILTSNSV
jgi:hypothetical protein